jgi:hypothetical protein
MITKEDLLTLANDEQLLEVGRLAIENELVEWRDARMAAVGRQNGFTICEPDGEFSNIIRFGPETGLRIALKAIAKSLS